MKDCLLLAFIDRHELLKAVTVEGARSQAIQASSTFAAFAHRAVAPCKAGPRLEQTSGCKGKRIGSVDTMLLIAAAYANPASAYTGNLTLVLLVKSMAVCI